MEIRRIRTLRGSNTWAWFPVLEALIDLGELKDSPSNELPGFNERVMSWLPTMIEHRCSIGERGGFFERLRRGTYQGHILEHVTLELQQLCGCDVGFGKARETTEEGVYKVVIEFEDAVLGHECFATAMRLNQAAVYDRPFDIKSEIARLREMADDVLLGPSTRAIVAAAETRNIPIHRLTTGSLVQLGWGARQRRILTAETDRTSAIAESIAHDKELTRQLLRTIGVPVPEGRPVSDAADAWEAAQEIGLPVVVKPRDSNHGRGVFTGLTSREQVAAAFAYADGVGSGVLVERFAPGLEHRLLVVNGQVVAASRGEPAVIVGDGARNVAQLIDEQLNSDPRRGEDCSSLLYTIELDPVTTLAIEQQGFQPDSVPAPGTRILIKRNGNVDTDITDRVHPDVAARAIEAARVVGLDIAGLDIVAEDIGRPLEDQGGAVVEVNAGPGLQMHVQPSAGSPRPVGEAIIATMFPAGETGRIPLAAVTGNVARTATARLLGNILDRGHGPVGIATSDGVYRNGDLVKRGDASGYDGARAVLQHPLVEWVVCEVSAQSVRDEGLGFDSCDVAVVTGVGQEHRADLADAEKVEQVSVLKRCVVEAVARDRGWAVLNAEDAAVVGMAEYCHGAVIFYARDPRNRVVVEHRAKGGRTASVVDNNLALFDADKPLWEIPVPEAGKLDVTVLDYALPAAAAAWALGLSADEIRRGLARFAPQTVDA
ncbi:MAG TPA: cyanophycin synthetase [Pirellulales bacterium]|jgi:cyanophycin synthetase